MEGLMLGDGVVLNVKYEYIGKDRKQVIEPGTPGTVIGYEKRGSPLVKFAGHIPVFVRAYMLDLLDGDGKVIRLGFSWDYYVSCMRREIEAARIEEGMAQIDAGVAL